MGEAVKNVEQILALKGKNLGLIIGYPDENDYGVEAAITIDGITKDCLMPNTHVIFPKGCVSIVPRPEDITVYLKKGEVYTEAEVASISLAPNTLTGRQEYMKVTLTTAPSTETADKVYIKCVRQLEPYIQQSLKVEPKQDSSEQSQLRSEIKHTTFDAMSVTVSQDELLGDTDLLELLFFDEYTGVETVPDDVTVKQMTSEPKVIYAYIPIEKGGEIESFMFFPETRAACKTLIDAKTGDDVGFSMEMSVDKLPLIVRPKAAA